MMVGIAAFGLVCFLVGRHRGIMDFDNAMVKAGKLPPRDSDDDFNLRNPF